MLLINQFLLISSGLSQPRAKLLAATMNVQSRKIVRRSLQSSHKGKLKLTGSQVVLHWISNNQKLVKQWV